MRLRLYKILSHVYMLCYVLCVGVLFIRPTLSYYFMPIGPSSWLISLGVGSAETTGPATALICFLWFVLFPLILIVTYILSLKNKPIPFCVVASIDAIGVILWVIYAAVSSNAYGVQTYLPDAIISGLVAAFLMYMGLSNRAQGQVDSSLVPSDEPDNSET